jgi:FkbH-like protein
LTLLEIRSRWQTLVRSGRNLDRRVAILASFTASPLVPYLGVALDDAGIPSDVVVGPYHQIVTECLSDESATARLRPHFVVVWPRLEELWGERPLPLDGDPARYSAAALEVAEASIAAAKRWTATLVFVLPSIPEVRPLGVGDAATPSGVFATATSAREALRARLSRESGVLVLDLEEIVRAVGAGRAHEPRLQALAHIPFSEELFAAAGERLARLLRLAARAACRVVVVDGDNTLWGGIVGEDGPGGVDLGENGPGAAFRAFQAYLLELRRAGVLVALCSKNDEADIWQVLGRREMRLRKEHLAAWRIGFRRKSELVLEIAEELGVGVDAVAFVDDNPAELEEVRVTLPEVACIRFPADPARWHEAVSGEGRLDRLPPTGADLVRVAHYEQERSRREERARSPEDYLERLECAAAVFEPAPSDIHRLAQLVHKTNQLNLNGRRRTEVELAGLVADPRHLVRLVSASDRFGDYGVVGAFALRVDGARAVLDTFVLSCRALGRGIELAMVASLFEEAERAGAGEVVATVESLPRNEPARTFFASLGCATSGTAAALARPPWPAHVRRCLNVP